MSARFQDMEEVDNPMNGRSVTMDQVDSFLRSLAGREPFMFELHGDHKSVLTIGLADDCASVQYSREDGLPPYVMAARDAIDEGDFVEFLAGGTPTPIPRRFCLPLDHVRRIVQEFLCNGEKSDCVQWEEV